MAQTIQLRRDNESNWTGVNPVLAQGELGVDLDSFNIKIGNGVSSWNELPYSMGGEIYAGTSFSTVSTDGAVMTGSVDSNGISLGIPNWLTTAEGGGGAGSWTEATTDGASIAISTATDVNTIFYGNFLTTYTQETAYVPIANSTDYATSNLSNSFQTTGNYLTTWTVPPSGTLSFINSNGISFGSSSDGSTTSVSASVETAYIPLANSTKFGGPVFMGGIAGYSWTTSTSGISTTYYLVTA